MASSGQMCIRDRGQLDYEDGLEEYRDGEQEYQDGLEEYKDGKEELKDGEEELEYGWDQLQDGVRQYNDALAKFEAGKAELEAREAEWEAGLTRLREELLPALEQLLPGTDLPNYPDNAALLAGLAGSDGAVIDSALDSARDQDVYKRQGEDTFTKIRRSVLSCPIPAPMSPPSSAKWGMNPMKWAAVL